MVRIQRSLIFSLIVICILLCVGISIGGLAHAQTTKVQLHLIKQWDMPYETEGLAVDSQGNIYVSDNRNSSVNEILLDGTIKTYKVYGSGCIGPNGLDVDSQGNIYVVTGHYYGRSVDVIPLNGLAKPLCKDTKFDSPVGIAVDSHGNVFVANENGELDVIMINKNNSDTVENHQVLLNNKFSSLIGVVVDSHDNIYVADFGDNMIKKIPSADGYPYYVRDYTKIYSENKIGFIELVKKGFANPGPCGLDVDSQGNIYVADTSAQLIKEIYPDGTMVSMDGGFRCPMSVRVDQAGNIYVLDYQANNTCFLSEYAAVPAQANAATPTPLPAATNSGWLLGGGYVTAPAGTNIKDHIHDNQITLPFNSSVADQTTNLVLDVWQVNNKTAEVWNMTLVSEVQPGSKNSNVGVAAEAHLNNLMTSAFSLNVMVQPVSSANIAAINNALRPDNLSVNGTPLAVVKIDKVNLKTDVDIDCCKLIITVPRSAGIQPNGNYMAIRLDDGGTYHRLNAILVKTPDNDPWKFVVESPDGFSQFTLVATKPGAVADTQATSSNSGSSSPTASPLSPLLSILAILIVTGMAAYLQSPKRK